MNEEVSYRRLFLICGVIGLAFVLLFVAVGVGATGKVRRLPDVKTTTTTATSTTTTDEQTVAASEPPTTVATQATVNTTTETTDNRYDFPVATTTRHVTIKNYYKVNIDFDGWQLFIDNAVYNAKTRTLTFDFQQVCTRKNAQPIYYEISQYREYDQPLALISTEQELTKPSLPHLYYTLDHLQARRIQVTVNDVEPNFGAIYIDLETLSLPDDDSAVNGGTIVEKRLILQEQQITITKS